MTRASTILAIAAASALLTPVVVHATGTPKAQAPMEKDRTVAAAPESARSPCARTVKVVYAGYGEAHANACVER